MMLTPRTFLIASAVAAILAVGAGRAASHELATLKGTWVLDSAFEIHADGSRTTNYGAHPSGLLTVDEAGRYNLQIFKIDRPAFASGVKSRGTADEYQQAVLGSSTHFGKVSLNAAQHQLFFDVEAASFPNWEGKRQVRDFTYQDGLLSYGVPATASADGTAAYSVWRRLRD